MARWLMVPLLFTPLWMYDTRVWVPWWRGTASALTRRR
jgi:hypothetical protein